MTEGSVARPWTHTEDIEGVWRSLTDSETTRAENLIDAVERGIVREWPDVLGRLENGTIAVDDIKDVVVWSVMGVLGIDTEIPTNAKAYQETSGSESRSITLDGTVGGGWLEFLPWMVKVFESGNGAARPLGPVSRFNAPPGGRFDPVGFVWPETGAQHAPGAESEWRRR